MNLSDKKIKLQIMKMDTNILEYEVKIEERLEDIERIKKQIVICENTKKELKVKLDKGRE